MDFPRSSSTDWFARKQPRGSVPMHNLYFLYFFVFGFRDSGLMSRFGEPIYRASSAADYFPPSPSSCPFSLSLRSTIITPASPVLTGLTRLSSPLPLQLTRLIFSLCWCVGKLRKVRCPFTLPFYLSLSPDSAPVHPIPSTCLLSLLPPPPQLPTFSSPVIHHLCQPRPQCAPSNSVAFLSIYLNFTPKLPSPEPWLHRRNTPSPTVVRPLPPPEALLHFNESFFVSE